MRGRIAGIPGVPRPRAGRRKLLNADPLGSEGGSVDLEDFGNAGEIIGAVAVIFSILYLARQINQNTALARAENQRELLNTAHLWHPLATTPGLTADIRGGLNRYSELDPDTQARFHHFMHPLVNHIEAVFRMHRQGLIEDDSCERWMAGLIGIISTPGGSSWWEHVKVMIGPEFIEELDRIREESDQLYLMTDLWHFYQEPPETPGRGGASAA